MTTRCTKGTKPIPVCNVNNVSRISTCILRCMVEQISTARTDQTRTSRDAICVAEITPLLTNSLQFGQMVGSKHSTSLSKTKSNERKVHHPIVFFFWATLEQGGLSPDWFIKNPFDTCILTFQVKWLQASKRKGHQAFSAKEQNRSLVLFFFWKILTTS